MSRFFMDTDNELWYTKAKELGVDVIRMPYSIDGEEYLDNLGEGIDFKEFYAKVKNGATAKTSALNMQDYIDYFEPVFANGEDIIYVHFSSQMSGTFQQMKLALDELKEKYPERSFKSVDTLDISISGGMLVCDAAKLWKNGATDDEIIKFVEDNRMSYCEYFLVDSLSYLKKGGRLSTTSYIAGTLLNLKPILCCGASGLIEKYSVANGKKKGIREIVNIVKELAVEPKKHSFIIANADADEYAEELKNLLIDAFGKDIDIWVQPIGPTVGSHCGPGTVGVAFFGKHR